MRGGEEIPRTVLRPERPGDTSKTRTRDSSFPEDPEEIAVREGVLKRIQAEIHHADKEAEDMAKEMLEVPPEWNEVTDLMMEDKDVRPATEGAAKRKIDEVARGQRKWRKEDDIRPEKRAHLPTVSRRT